MEPKSKIPIMGFINNPIKTVLTLLAILLLLLVGAYLVFGSPYIYENSYFTVVIDCGSTGTRVNVYVWIKNSGSNNKDLPFLVHSYPNNSISYHQMQTEPGLDKFVGNSSGIRVSIEPLIYWAKRWVPKERHLETPIFVLATAGLRKLQKKDATWVLRNIEAVLKEQSFVYKKNWIRVLSGKDEAYYGWVALNYKMGVLNKSNYMPSLGLLDLGGSSLQVVAEVDDLSKDGIFTETNIGPLKHRVLAYSWSEFGLNEAFDRTVVMLSHSQRIGKSPSGVFEVAHPCLGHDFAKNYSCDGCFEHRNDTDLGSFHDERTTSIALIGKPNWEHCKLLARAVAVNSSSLDWSRLKDKTSYKQGKLKDVATTSVLRYHALSGFFAVYSSLGLNQRANTSSLWEKGEHLCSNSWANISSISANKNYAAQYCFQVPYMVSLIEDTLCISDKEIIFGPGDISWTLGAALVEAQFLWLGSSNDLIHILVYKNSGVITFTIILFVFLIGLLYIVYRCQIKLPMLGGKRPAIVASLPLSVFSKHSPN